MDLDTIIVHMEDGVFQGFETTDLSLRRAVVVTNGSPERVVEARHLTTEQQITRALQVIRAGNLSGAWHGLDGAGDETSAALSEAAEVCAELAARLRDLCGPRQTRRDPAELLADFDALHPLRTGARVRLAAGIDALDAFDAICGQARETIAAADDGAHQGRHRLAVAL